MQPYAYAAYPNPNSATMPVHYMAPTNYPQSSPPFVNQSLNHYTGIPTTGQPIQYAPQPLNYPVEYMMPILPPHPMPIVSQQFQHPQGYYYNSNASNGVNPTALSDAKTTAAVKKKGAKSQGSKNLVANNNANNLLKQKGTKVKLSKIYRISNKNPGFQDNDSSDDEYEQVPLDSPQPRTLKQSSIQFKRLSTQIQRIPSAASSCSHCSTCTNCSCSACHNPNGEHVYDDCPQCRAEWEYQQVQSRRQKHK